MAFSKPFSEAERTFIRKRRGRITSGEIARLLNEEYKQYNNGERTPEGVRSYLSTLESDYIKVNIELSRSVKDKISDAGLDPIDVSDACEKGIKDALKTVFKQKQRAQT